ncbi:MAG: hypothetical protein ACXAEU_06295 [Candidatus Hodarchaeales archaeon]|jgi:hypothetical protein
MKASKKMQYAISITLLVVVMVGMVNIPFFYLSTSSTRDILVLYDIADETTIKTKNLLLDTLQSEVPVTIFPIQSSEQLESTIVTHTGNIIVYIFHGTMDGLVIGNIKVSWTRLSELVDNSNIQVHQFLSCYSYLVESQEKLVIGQEGRVDFLIAGLSAARTIAEFKSSMTVIDRIDRQTEEFKYELIYRAIFPVEPLWWGNTHNKIATKAVSKLISSYFVDGTSMSDWLETFDNPYSSNDPYDLMKKAGEADDVDGVSDLMDDPVKGVKKLLLNEGGARTKWLKHFGGTVKIKFQVRIHTIFGDIKITLFTEKWRGTAARSAEDAFNKAVKYWLKGTSYYRLEAAKHLSYAVHYLQDMSNPYHTHDITIEVSNSLISDVFNFASVIDYFDDHNRLEKYVRYNWKSDWSSSASVQAINDVSDAVNDLIDESRAQSLKCMDSSGDIKDSNTNLQKALKNLLNKAIGYTAGLYQRFCNAVETRIAITSPSSGYRTTKNFVVINGKISGPLSFGKVNGEVLLSCDNNAPKTVLASPTTVLDVWAFSDFCWISSYGAHAILVDYQGKSASITVTRVPPGCKITSPSNGVSYNAPYSCTVRGITKTSTSWVRVYLDGTFKGYATLTNKGGYKSFSFSIGNLYGNSWGRTYTIKCTTNTGYSHSVSFIVKPWGPYIRL